MIKKKRIESLVDLLFKQGVDGYLMGAGYDLKFLTEIEPSSDERFKGLFILNDGRSFFICPELYYEDFRNELGKDMHMYVWSDNEGVNDTFKKAKEDYELKGKIIAIDDSIRGVDLLDMIDIMKSNFINGKNISKNLRIIKDDEGLDN